MDAVKLTRLRITGKVDFPKGLRYIARRYLSAVKGVHHPDVTTAKLVSKTLNYVP